MPSTLAAGCADVAIYTLTPSGDVLLAMTATEARALSSMAGEGAAGLLNNASAARAYIGGPSNIAAGQRALQALQSAAVSCTPNMPKSV